MARLNSSDLSKTVEIDLESTDQAGAARARSARNQIGPLLQELILRLDAEGQATQKAHFKRIQHHLDDAADDWELTHPIIELSTCVAMGFRFSSDATPLINRILEKTEVLVSELEGTAPTQH
ncbi:MAG: hypothetical protein AAF541_00540 [Pseudomonadota bacterium]